MPLYDYECEEGHVHDKIKKFSECSDPSVCPTCGKTAKRIMSAQFSFEGSGAGFYNNMWQGHSGTNVKKEVWEKKFPKDKSTQ